MKKKSKLPTKLQQKLLEAVVQLMIGAGISSYEIRAALAKELQEARRARVSGKLLKKNNLRDGDDVAAQLLRAWHRDSKYLDAIESRPRPLPLLRGKSSLKSIVFGIDPKANAVNVLASMRSVGLIRKTANGRYLPTAQANLIPCMHPWALEHTARSVIRLVSTVARNAAGELGKPSLLERYSYVPDLDPREVEAFASFSRAQGQSYLDTLDDWLEQRREKVSVKAPKNRAGIAAGVHVIAYFDQDALRGSSTAGEVKSKKRFKPRARSVSGLRTEPTSHP